MFALYVVWSLLGSVLAELPSCYREGQTCDLTESNLLDWTIADSVETCREACNNYSGGHQCTVFSYHGSTSSPFQKVCLLLSSCLSTSPCTDCVTESVSDCTCSLPYQCYANSDNMLEILSHPLPSEQACRTICFDSENCTTYNYYDVTHPSRGLCVLLTSCRQLVMEPCQGCHTGPARCSDRGETCQLAVWSSLDSTIALTSSSTITLLSGEPTCTREVNMMAVGGGGGSLANRAGAGSGMVVFNQTLITANREVEVVVGSGGASNQTGGESSVSYRSGETLLTAGGGGRADLTDGGDGYSGGGAQGGQGGSDGGDGEDYGPHYEGGAGSGLNISDVSFESFSVSAGEAGLGDQTYGGGGGGGVLVSGPGLEQDRPVRHPGDGEGWGGGAGGASEGNVGEQGLVILEIIGTP